MRRLCATVLLTEIVVIWLAVPVAISIEHAPPRSAILAGVAAAAAALTLAVLARRRLRWTIVGGSGLQALVLAAGVIVPALYVLGVIFAALWVTGIWLGRRVDMQVAAAAAGSPSGISPAGQGPLSHQPGTSVGTETRKGL